MKKTDPDQAEESFDKIMADKIISDLWKRTTAIRPSGSKKGSHAPAKGGKVFDRFSPTIRTLIIFHSRFSRFEK